MFHCDDDSVMAGQAHSVLVFDMARTGEPDGEHLIAGFPSIEAAEAYARARTRASVEELRAPGQSAAELRSLWHVYGEDCSVLGHEFTGRAALDFYIANPAAREEIDWAALAPGTPAEAEQAPRKLHRYHVAALVTEAANQSVWVGGFLNWPQRPTGPELLEHYRADAIAAFERQGIADARPATIHVAQAHELPDVPRAPGSQPMKHWHIDLDFICHDVKFGMDLAAVFSWPQEPRGEDLAAMTRLMIADAMSVRGDGPSWADEAEITSLAVRETDAPPTYPDLPVV